ncbi:MAG: NAD(P)H-hydrate epimerase, partial [Casimicrobiaceae bacterium]
MQSPPICDVAAIRALEERALGRAAGATPLMELAGAAAAGQARLLAPRTAEPVVVFAGPGNNGGDAFVVARHLREWGYPVTVVFDADPLRLPADARKACDRWLAAGGHTIANPPALADCALVVDGLFGIGLSRALTGVHAEWIAAINRSGVRVLALDLPSGLDADSGVIHGPVIEAAHTATFIALKPGLVTGSGVDVAGDITVHDLGLDARSVACGRYVEWSDARL